MNNARATKNGPKRGLKALGPSSGVVPLRGDGTVDQPAKLLTVPCSPQNAARPIHRPSLKFFIGL
jgi:hypothetical protein